MKELLDYKFFIVEENFNEDSGKNFLLEEILKQNSDNSDQPFCLALESDNYIFLAKAFLFFKNKVDELSVFENGKIKIIFSNIDKEKFFYPDNVEEEKNFFMENVVDNHYEKDEKGEEIIFLDHLFENGDFEYNMGKIYLINPKKKKVEIFAENISNFIFLNVLSWFSISENIIINNIKIK